VGAAARESNVERGRARAGGSACQGKSEPASECVWGLRGAVESGLAVFVVPDEHEHEEQNSLRLLGASIGRARFADDEERGLAPGGESDRTGHFKEGLSFKEHFTYIDRVITKSSSLSSYACL